MARKKVFGFTVDLRELPLRVTPRLLLPANQENDYACHMMNWTKPCFVAASFLAISAEAAASCEIDISNYVGWTIIYSGTVTGYIDENGEEQDDFEGCEYDRVLIIDYTKAVTCSEYSYSYAYRPDIAIISDGSSMEACIDDEMYIISK